MNPKNRIALVLLLLAAALLPLMAGTYWVTLTTQFLIFGMLALSADLLLGHAGLFSLCHAAFFAVSAYTTAILQVRYGVSGPAAVAAGVLAGTLLGMVFGLSVRTRGVYFILVTLAMGYIIWGVGYRWTALTGGDSGITNVPAPAIGGMKITNASQFYYLVLTVVVLVLAVYHRLVNSPFGLALRGIKTGEPRMRSLGFRPAAHLYAAFVLSSFMASIAGVLYVYLNRFVNPVAASLHNNVEAVLMAIVGGSGTLLGPFIGAALVLGLRNWVSTFFELHLVVMGLVFIAVVIWAPGGVIGLVRRVLSSSGKGGQS
jgi:branched-chain amino acid transport system permease protein